MDSVEIFTRALACILRDVRLSELIDLEKVCGISDTCAIIYARECDARHMTPKRYKYLYNHYGERLSRVLVGRLSYMRMCAKLYRGYGPPPARMQDINFRVHPASMDPSGRGIIQNECGFRMFEIRQDDDVRDNPHVLALPHASARLFDITHVTVFFDTDRPIGDTLTLKVTLGINTEGLKTYRFAHDGSGYVRLPILDGYTGLLINQWTVNTPCYLRSDDVRFHNEYIAVGHMSMTAENEFGYLRRHGTAFTPFLTHPRYANGPGTDCADGNGGKVFSGNNDSNDPMGIHWNTMLYGGGSVAIRYAPIPHEVFDLIDTLPYGQYAYIIPYE